MSVPGEGLSNVGILEGAEMWLLQVPPIPGGPEQTSELVYASVGLSGLERVSLQESGQDASVLCGGHGLVCFFFSCLGKWFMRIRL